MIQFVGQFFVELFTGVAWDTWRERKRRKRLYNPPEKSEPQAGEQ